MDSFKITPFVILIISVLELNVWEFRQISNSLVRLVVVSFIIEVGFIGVFTYILQFETLAWAQFSSYGFIWPAICPAVLVPSLLQLKRMGYGEESGVINLLVAASCILEVLTNMTDGFLECLSVFNVSSTYVKIILFAEELFIELGIGIIFGVIMMFVPSNAWTKLSSILKKRKNDNPHINKNQNIVSLLSIIRAILLCFVGLLIGLYKWYTDLPITYSLGCAISTILASTSWKCKNQNNINPTISSSKGINNQAQHEINAISKIFEFIWNVLHPLIFVLIGYDLSYTIYSINTAMVLTGIIIFMVVIIIRIITATCSVWGTGFNYNEIIFINMAWIVNSSIMTCFTTTSHLFGQTPLEDFYNQIVLIIGIFLLLRVFLGSFVIHKFGPILLTNTVQYGH